MKAQKLLETLAMNGKRGQMNNILTLIVGIILFVAVALPVTIQVIANVTLSGTTATIVNLVPIFIAIGLLVLVVRSVMGSGN